MSIVLDALRRADRERRHTSHAQGLGETVLQPADSPATTPMPPARPDRRWAWGSVAALAAVAAVAWSLRFSSHRPVTDGIRSVPSAARAAASAASKASAAAAVADASGARNALPPLPTSQPQAVRPVQSAPRPASARTVAATGPVPDHWRGRLAQWRFGGALDSTDAAHRMVFIDSQLYREGDEPAPGLKLVRIRLRSALFEADGRRFEWTY